MPSNQFCDLATRNERLSRTAALILIVGCPVIAPAQLTAFVTNRGSDNVSVIDLTTLQVTSTIAVGTGPVGLAIDGTRELMYVANSGSASVTRTDLRTGMTTTLSLPGSLPEAIAVTPDGELVLATSLERVPITGGSRGRVYVIDGPGLTLIDSVLVEDDPEAVEISVDGRSAWFASDLKIQEILLQPGLDFLLLTDVFDGIAGVHDFEDVAVVLDKSKLFATNDDSARIEAIDLSNEMSLGTVPAGVSPEAVVLRPDSSEAHVTNQFADSITIFDMQTLAVVGTVALSLVEPRGLDFRPDGSEAYVAMSGSSAVVRYNTTTRMEVGAPIAVGSLPEEIVVVSFLPEVEVQMGAIAVVDGSSTIDFGPRAFGETPSAVTLAVRNLGDRTLTTSGLSASGGFMVTDPLQPSILPGDSDTIVITLPTTVAGAFSGTVSFTNNDADESPFTFGVSGEVTAPGAVIWVDFGFVGIETGGFLAPFNTLLEATGIVNPGGAVRLGSGDSPETLVVSKAVRLEALNGPVRLGVVGAPPPGVGQFDIAGRSGAGVWNLYE